MRSQSSPERYLLVNRTPLARGMLARMHVEKPACDERDVVQERRRRTTEFGYRVCGLWTGEVVDERPRICVMPRGHQTSPHRYADGEKLLDDPYSW